jgi:hypothetical protein
MNDFDLDSLTNLAVCAAFIVVPLLSSARHWLTEPQAADYDGSSVSTIRRAFRLWDREVADRTPVARRHGLRYSGKGKLVRTCEEWVDDWRDRGGHTA